MSKFDPIAEAVKFEATAFLGSAAEWRENLKRECVRIYEAGRRDERERTYDQILAALRLAGFDAAAVKVEEWKGISDRFPENAAAGTGTPDVREAPWKPPTGLVMRCGVVQSETFMCPYCKHGGYLAAIEHKGRARSRRIAFFHEHNRNTHCVLASDTPMSMGDENHAHDVSECTNADAAHDAGVGTSLAASPSIREPGLRPKGEPCECVHAPEQHGSRGCGVVRAFGESCPCLWMGKRSKPGPRPDHYIISLKWTSGNHTTTFEREGRRGYTTRINQAGLWTKEDAEKATEGSRGDSLAVDRADVDEFAVRVLPAERAFELARKREPAGDPPTSEPVTVPFGAGTLTVDHLAETCAHGIPTATCTEHAKPCAACNGERFVSNVSSKGQRQRAPCTNCNLAAYGTPPLFPWPPTSEGSK